ncbi:MAG TPA: Gfo/Idh/MocA family oxidoreductase [Vicinamibacterales bacterium]
MTDKFILIGAGRMGMAHLQAARNIGLTPVAVCDVVDSNRVKAAAAVELPPDRLFDDAVRMFEAHQQADLVIIATTADSHRTLVEQAARSGARHILCEKPMATSVADCDAMIGACVESGSQLAINHQMRFMAQYTVVRDELATGRFGRLASMTVTGGCFGLAMNGSHYCEAFAWLTGSPIVNATAWFSGEAFNNPRGPQFFDQAGEMRFTSADGRRLLLNIGNDQGHGMTVMYAARFGHLFVDEFEGLCLATARKPEHQSMPVTRYGMPWDRWERRFAQADNVGPTEAVMRALLDGSGYPNGTDGRNVVAALAAAYKSAASGNVPVNVDSLGDYEGRRFPWA